MNKLFNQLNLPGVGTCYVKGFIPCGDWQPNTHYAFSSLVRQGDASYICINPDGSSASPQDLFLSANNQILQLQNGSYVQASSNISPDWQELCRDGAPGAAGTPTDGSAAVYNGETEFRLGNPSSYVSIGRTSANQSENWILYIPYASADKHGVIKSSDYTSLMDMLNNYPTLLSQVSQLIIKVSDSATKDYVHEYVGNGALHLKVNGTELTPEGGLFTANKGGDSTIDIPVPTSESIEESTLNKLGDKIVLKNNFSTELAKEMAEVLSTKNEYKGLIFNFEYQNRRLECNPDILSVNYTKVKDYYRLNISGSFLLNGFNFAEQKAQNNYDPVLYSVKSGTLNNGKLSTEKTGMLYLRLSALQATAEQAYGPVMFELSVFVEKLSSDYNAGIYGTLDIKQFYS